MNYTNYIGGLPPDVDGMGVHGISRKPYSIYKHRGIPFLLWNEYFAIKLIKGNHRIQYSYNSSRNGVYNFNPQTYTGLWNRDYTIHSLGYGYRKKLLGTDIILLAGICRRQGSESAIHYISQQVPDVICASWMIYQKPWGGMLGVQAEYFVTKNIGIGFNYGYYFFPFENAKLTGNFIEILNPQMQDNTKPVKQLIIASAKLSYRFTVWSPKSKKH